jgi:hypothetical protein
MSFLSREIVFLFPNNHDDMNSFFENLMLPSSTSPFIHVPSNILGSINVEISGEVCNSMNSFSFIYEGDGTHPYMDMLNAITKIADFHGLDARLDGHIKDYYFMPSIAKSLLRQYMGYLDSGHDYLLRYFLPFYIFKILFLRSKIDAITIQAKGDEISDDHDSVQVFYKFMISAIRSLCNAIEHFQHETAIYFPTTEHNYYEFMDYLPIAVIIILPCALLVQSQ